MQGRVGATVGTVVVTGMSGVTEGIACVVVIESVAVIVVVIFAAGVFDAGAPSEGIARNAMPKQTSKDNIAAAIPSKAFLPGVGGTKFARPDWVGGICAYLSFSKRDQIQCTPSISISS